MRLNFTEIYMEVMHRCSELFTGYCWWRKKYMNCCDILVQQKCEYGICYSFNSAVNKEGFTKTV